MESILGQKSGPMLAVLPDQRGRPWCLLCLCGRQFICALSSPAGKGLTSWLSFVVSNCEFVTFPLVSWVRCGTWLYRFLIFAPLLTMEFHPQKCSVLSVSRSRSPIRHSYKLNGHILITEDTAKYLELGVDLQTTPQQTCLYGSHMGYPYGTHMGSATGFGMGPIWVSPYAGCPDGSHMGPI